MWQSGQGYDVEMKVPLCCDNCERKVKNSLANMDGKDSTPFTIIFKFIITSLQENFRGNVESLQDPYLSVILFLHVTFLTSHTAASMCQVIKDDV